MLIILHAYVEQSGKFFLEKNVISAVFQLIRPLTFRPFDKLRVNELRMNGEFSLVPFR